jgi:hypothetical protein
MPLSRRDKDATWRSSFELGWSKPHLLHELQAERPYQTFPPLPPDTQIDWHEQYVKDHLDVHSSQLTKFVLGPRVPPILASRQRDIGIRVWSGPPSTWPSATATAPAASPALPQRKPPTPKDIGDCILAIKKEREERSEDPPNRDDLCAQVSTRLKRR